MSSAGRYAIRDVIAVSSATHQKPTAKRSHDYLLAMTNRCNESTEKGLQVWQLLHCNRIGGLPGTFDDALSCVHNF